MSILCKMGLHGRLVGGLGGMGDAILCLRCGREKYEEHWAPWDVARARTCTDADQEAVAAARALPGGIEAAVAQPDPEFDAWLARTPILYPERDKP